RLGHWPVEVFQTLLPVNPKVGRGVLTAPSPDASQEAAWWGHRALPSQRPLRFDQTDLGDMCEVAPIVWQKRLALMKCNRPVCGGKNGFVMAYESDDPKFTPFTVKFATSPDLESWSKLPDAIFGADRYAACPCIRYANGSYYLLYLEHRTPRWFFETYLARSKDLQ